MSGGRCPHRKDPSLCKLCLSKTRAPRASSGKAELDALRARVAELASARSDKAAIVLTAWLHERPARGRSRGKKAA